MKKHYIFMNQIIYLNGEIMKKAKIHIDKRKFKENYNYYANGKNNIIFVVKSNGYGCDINKITHLLLNEGANYFAVFTIKEALKIRKISSNSNILILNSIEEKDIHICEKNNFTVTINTLDDYLLLKKTNLSVHIKIDTGLHRLGLYKEEFDIVFNDKSLNIKGIFSHLVGGKENIEYLTKQIETFDKIISHIDHDKYLIHICSSSSFNLVKSKYQNTVRIGMGIYGFSSFLNPCISLSLPIISKKEIKKNEYCSYDCSFKTSEDGFLYVIPIGYSNWLSPIIKLNYNGFEVAGKICMNTTILFSKNDYKRKVITLNGYDLINICNYNNISIYWLLSSFSS